MPAGYVYILINNSMPGLLKIGKTKRDSRARASELSTTGVPTPFTVAYETFSEAYEELETQVHEALSDFRVSANREFFRYPLDKAIAVVSRLTNPPTDKEATFTAEDILERLKTRYPNCLDPTIAAVRIVQTHERVWLEITREETLGGYLVDQVIRRTDLGFITQGVRDLYFPPGASVSENARRFVGDFGPFSIVMTTDLFHKEACKLIVIREEGSETNEPC